MPLEAMWVFWRSRVLSDVVIGILEPKRVLVTAVSVCKGRESVCKVRESACKGHKSACRSSESACISHESATRNLETVAEA